MEIPAAGSTAGNKANFGFHSGGVRSFNRTSTHRTCNTAGFRIRALHAAMMANIPVATTALVRTQTRRMFICALPGGLCCLSSPAANSSISAAISRGLLFPAQLLVPRKLRQERRDRAVAQAFGHIPQTAADQLIPVHGGFVEICDPLWLAAYEPFGFEPLGEVSSLWRNMHPGEAHRESRPSPDRQGAAVPEHLQNVELCLRNITHFSRRH